ncbi:dienelactone hydrolase family protein [bacterium]|nr:dienelactone hydrolase family protein [bacterium]
MKNLFALALLSSSVATAAQPQGQSLVYNIGAQAFEGYRVGSGKKGSVLVVHDWMGLTERTKAKADAFAELGYTVFAVDVFGRGVRPASADAARENSVQYYKNRTLLRERVAAGLNQLQKIAPNKNTAAVGYCFGGTSVIELARSGAELKAIVSFHGGLDSPAPSDGKNIKARVLALHGADDPYVSAANLLAFEDEMRTHKIDWQLIKFGGAVHSFTDRSAGNDNSKGAAYNERADKRSWQAMKSFLEESFQ